MKISDIVHRTCIRVPLAATDRFGVITELVDLLHDHEPFPDREDVLAAIVAREQTRSTGIGHGLAVPHGKSQGCKALRMAIGVPGTPVDFASPDGQHCKFIALLASPIDRTGPHIQALARISRLWLTEEFCIAVSNVKTAEDLHAIICKYEN